MASPLAQPTLTKREAERLRAQGLLPPLAPLAALPGLVHSAAPTPTPAPSPPAAISPGQAINARFAALPLPDQIAILGQLSPGSSAKGDSINLRDRQDPFADDLLKLLKEQGLETMAEEIGLVQGGRLNISGTRPTGADAPSTEGAPQKPPPTAQRARSPAAPPMPVQAPPAAPPAAQPLPQRSATAPMDAPAMPSSHPPAQCQELPPPPPVPPMPSARKTAADRTFTYKQANGEQYDYDDDEHDFSARGHKRPRKLSNGAGGAANGGAGGTDTKGKGLRHFSMKVLRKVEQKEKTTYNEVADELVEEFSLNPADGDDMAQYDEKNIRRRVYDALNVLMAMDIIEKDKKEIKWKGLPSNGQHDMDALQRESQDRSRSIEKKQALLRELLLQLIALRNLRRRNIHMRGSAGPGAQHKQSDEESKIQLPFIVINTHNTTLIQCEMAENRADVFFNFSDHFEIADDNEILQRMGLHCCTHKDLQALIAPELFEHVPESAILPPIHVPRPAYFESA